MVKVKSIAVNEAEKNPPVASNPDGMESGILTVQRVQLEAGNVDIVDRSGLIDNRQPVFDAADLVGG
ncbi:hypothetical protein [Methylobacterium sp. GC_Met_2]|uniref:hypothetical protein n=1 Tax=Methylobacterium sp. GC_Met_2 TaxID=2937376 RepID=UPI00226B3D28|nr:hypothetical protein [Methylobacterium sp. GC_Met_2]